MNKFRRIDYKTALSNFVNSCRVWTSRRNSLQREKKTNPFLLGRMAMSSEMKSGMRGAGGRGSRALPQGTTGGSLDTSTHNGFLHRSKISLDLEPGTKVPEHALPPPLYMQSSTRRAVGGDPVLGGLRNKGFPSKPFGSSGLNLSSKGTRENGYLPSNKNWSSFRNPVATDNKYDEFDENKTNGYGNLSK